MTKTCSQCGAVLPLSVRACNFCESSFFTDSSSFDQGSSDRTRQNLALGLDCPAVPRADAPAAAADAGGDPAWRGELAQRLQAYRTRRRRLAPNSAQSQLPFEERGAEPHAGRSVTVAEPSVLAEEDFSFTIAIGRPSEKRLLEDSPMEIDVSLPPAADEKEQRTSSHQKPASQTGLFPVASLEERRLAALIDAGCLLFAYGGFLALFGSLGGEFTLSKLSAAVYTLTFAIVYLQYFALFTVFGGTTPGMMLRGLEVVSFSGEPPSPQQLLLRSTGYLLSAGTFFLGFLWAMWDEDALTWHDRLSHTYLSAAHAFADMESSSVAHSR